MLLLALARPLPAQDLQPVPPLETRVTDLTGTLTAGQQAELEQKLLAFEQRKGAQVALLIVPTTEPEAIEQYSIRVVDAWKLGREKPDDGALLLVALQDRDAAHRGGLRPGRRAARCHLAAASSTTPSSRCSAGRLFRWRQRGAAADHERRRRRATAAARPAMAPAASDRLFGLLPLLFFGVLIGGAVLRAILGRTLGALATGGLAGGVVWLLSQLLGYRASWPVCWLLPSACSRALHPMCAMAATLAVVVASEALVAADLVVAASGGGGFGGGGFGGGGGGFGGGGASGRW